MQYSSNNARSPVLKYFIEKVHKESFALLPRPRVVVGVPSSVTEVEKKAVVDATMSAGAREAYLIEEPMAAAIGVRLPVQEAAGNMVVDIGGGTAEIAVISLGGIVASRSLRNAGDELNENIVQYSRDNFNLLLGEKTAEDIKIAIGSAYPLEEKAEIIMRGRDLVTGLPKEVTISDEQARAALGDVRILTTDEVLTGFLNALSEGGETLRSKAGDMVRAMLENPNVTVVPQTRGSFLAGVARYERRRDKTYSLTDCISMNAMDDHGARDALTNDRHFQQEGYTVLIPGKGDAR